MSAWRYAVYFAPRTDSVLWRLGCAWLGRDAVTDTPVVQPRLTDHSGVDLEAATAAPRRYGFHATLKAPFRLRPHCSEDELIRALAAISVRHMTFSITLHVGEQDGFLALLPTSPSTALDRLAADCVRDMDMFRAPLTDADRRRRKADSLSFRHRALFEQWGYPDVMEAYRFHMTLSERLPDEPRARLRTAAANHFTDALDNEETTVDSVCLFREITPGSAFRLVHRLNLASATNAPRELV